MQFFNKTFRRIGLKYSLIAVLLMVGWFIAMQLVGLSNNTGLRAVNLIFIGGAIMMAARELKNEDPEGFRYFPAFGMGLRIGAFTGFVFAAIMLIYMTVFDPKFFAMMEGKLDSGPLVTFLFSALAIFMETFASAMIFSLISVQWFKRPMEDVDKPADIVKSHTHVGE